MVEFPVRAIGFAINICSEKLKFASKFICGISFACCSMLDKSSFLVN